MISEITAWLQYNRTLFFWKDSPFTFVPSRSPIPPLKAGTPPDPAAHHASILFLHIRFFDHAALDHVHFPDLLFSRSHPVVTRHTPFSSKANRSNSRNASVIYPFPQNFFLLKYPACTSLPTGVSSKTV